MTRRAMNQSEYQAMVEALWARVAGEKHWRRDAVTGLISVGAYDELFHEFAAEFRVDPTGAFGGGYVIRDLHPIAYVRSVKDVIVVAEVLLAAKLQERRVRKGGVVRG